MTTKTTYISKTTIHKKIPQRGIVAARKVELLTGRLKRNLHNLSIERKALQMQGVADVGDPVHVMAKDPRAKVDLGGAVLDVLVGRGGEQHRGNVVLIILGL